ncbi:calcium-binding protein [Rhodobacter sp. 24-YEA-8]|uniref:calcium-binding protein n=1 Tax=Rhodobacter sp. 24-YEA-8 TaxID=1884310 RepID=UPI000898ECFF|nr:calcium-binding protein [Rhodobacter sp. 24-YEA-8]SED49170.1 Hemolysin-type calcium-binding repeat-containing protein [Rhodobacter sp. 24-YEA-8]
MGFRTGYSGRDHCSERLPPRAISCIVPRESVTTGSQTVVTAISVSVAAAADAYGTATLANAVINIDVVSRGLLSFAWGQVSILGAATGPDGENGYVSGYIGIDLAGLSQMDMQVSAQGDAAGMSAGVTFLSVTLALPEMNIFTSSGQASAGSVSYGDQLSGNLATFTASITAEGANSSAELQAEAFAAEEQMSSVVLSGQAATYETTEFITMTGTRGADVINAVTGDTLVWAAAGKDTIRAGAGDDWLFAEDGKDSVFAGAGNDAAFGGVGEDGLWGEDGDDWLFGGRGDDSLFGGSGEDLLLGGAGSDRIDGGAGNDLIEGGTGRDMIFGGAGNDIFRMGTRAGDDDDIYRGGSGADLWLITGRFDDDLIQDFRIAEGDRLLGPGGGWDDPAIMGLRNGTMLSFSRSACDRDDLEITFRFDGRTSVLTLDEFFTLNPGYGSAIPIRGVASDSQAEMLMRNIFGDDLDVYADSPSYLLMIGNQISDLG